MDLPVPELIKAKSFSRKEIEEISSVLSSEAELIIATIIDGDAFIFEVRPSGEVVLQPNYAIIGTIAQASAFMQWRCVTADDALPSVLYDVYEAKRFSEMDKDIGPQTSMYVLTPNGKIYQIKVSYLEVLDRMRRKFDRERINQHLPKKVTDWRCAKPEEFEF